MDDPFGVRRLEPTRRLDQEVDGLDDRERPALADELVEIASFDVLHHEEMNAPILVGVKGGDDVGVLQAARGFDLALEAQDGGAVARKEGGRILSATIRFSRRCRALKTTPMPPAPSLSRMR